MFIIQFMCNAHFATLLLLNPFGLREGNDVQLDHCTHPSSCNQGPRLRHLNINTEIWNMNFILQNRLSHLRCTSPTNHLGARSPRCPGSPGSPGSPGAPEPQTMNCNFAKFGAIISMVDTKVTTLQVKTTPKFDKRTPHCCHYHYSCKYYHYHYNFSFQEYKGTVIWRPRFCHFSCHHWNIKLKAPLKDEHWADIWPHQGQNYISLCIIK